MIENIIHKNEKLNLTFKKEIQEIHGHFTDGKIAFIFVYHIFGNCVKICDFKVYKKREGLGTKVLAEFESRVKKNGYEKIYGELVDNPDFSPPEVLKNFYKKMGYEIEEVKLGMKYAEISKKLM